MKFQNSSIHGFKVMLCIKKRDERTDGRTDGRTNNPEAICPSNFFEVGGIKMFLLKEKKKNLSGADILLMQWQEETMMMLLNQAMTWLFCCTYRVLVYLYKYFFVQCRALNINGVL